MSNRVIQVESLSKQYRLGQVGTKSLSDDLKRWIAKMKGETDPFLTVGEENDRTKSGNSDYVWALRDISFEVNQGEILGIIGKNGAGKSTLLKILSQVTRPTTGSYKIKGRIASLLEVGTGFHPDLTGRENVFLNGAILGMTKKEIASKFDAIVDFSGVERYIDTPVKRYSSGMYVRLAFAVAAHLEPEILIIDEVLAVGDVEFQKKCLGKMKDVSSQGRTVLFVSHNTVAIETLCTRGLLIERGKVGLIGSTGDVLEHYLFDGNKNHVPATQSIVPSDWIRPWGQRGASFVSVELFNEHNQLTNELHFLEPFKVKITFEVKTPILKSRFQVRVAKQNGEQITRSDSELDTNICYDFPVGKHSVTVSIDPKLMPGQYCFVIHLSSYDGTIYYDAITNFYMFSVIPKTKDNKIEHYPDKINTFVHLPGAWETQTF